MSRCRYVDDLQCVAHGAEQLGWGKISITPPVIRTANRIYLFYYFSEDRERALAQGLDRSDSPPTCAASIRLALHLAQWVLGHFV